MRTETRAAELDEGRCEVEHHRSSSELSDIVSVPPSISSKRAKKRVRSRSQERNLTINWQNQLVNDPDGISLIDVWNRIGKTGRGTEILKRREKQDLDASLAFSAEDKRLMVPMAIHVGKCQTTNAKKTNRG